MDEDRMTASIRVTVATVKRHVSRNWKSLYLGYIGLVSLFALVTIYTVAGLEDTKEVDSTSLFKRWGGFKDHPETNKCYKQERTAILLSIFLGSLGVDQFYAHHWPLAVCKLLFCLPAVVVRIVLWICALVEPDECRVVIPIFLLFGPWCAWTVTDVILWTVGGVYGTPGCAGTWKH